MPGSDMFHRVDDLLHLDEEDIALAAEGEQDPAVSEHLATCAICRERVAQARDLFRVEPLRVARDSDREDALLQRLTAVGAIPEAAPEVGLLRVILEDGSVRVLQTNTEIRIQRRVATRSVTEGESEPNPGVAFFRRLGDVEIEVHLIKLPTGRFHLVVGAVSEDPTRALRVALHRGPRQLALEPAQLGTVTFKNLRPDRYWLAIHDRNAQLGRIELDVEARAPEVNP
ncbi:MAG: hypothetical protein AAFS10_20285 [Myxococcota bacterium]